MDAGFAEADVVVEETYPTACEIHTPIETHGSVAKWDGNRLTVWDSTQGVYPVQAGLAQTLKLPLSKVRVIGHYMGGGFGRKLSVSKYTVIAALLARKTARPVKLFLTREETLPRRRATGPPATMTLKAGVKKDGTLTALQMTCSARAAPIPAAARAASTASSATSTRARTCKTELTDVYINAGQARAFRAPGHPQGAWALEQMMDALAEKIGMDPVELRLKNVPTVSQATTRTSAYTTTGLTECLARGREGVRLERGARDAAPRRRRRSCAASAWPPACGRAARAGRRPPSS